MIELREYDDDFDYDSEMETYYYKVYYVTYYMNDDTYLSPVEEQEDISLSDIPVDDNIDDELYRVLTTIEQKIDDAVAKGNYQGLWLHEICIPIESDYKQVDVDDYQGTSNILKNNINVDSIEVDLPEDWTSEDDDFTYLADIAMKNKTQFTESVMNMSVLKSYRNKTNCNEELEIYEIGKRYPDFQMLEPFILNYDVDLDDLEVGDIIIRDWQFGHLPNTGYIPMLVVDVDDRMRIVVETTDGKQHTISKDFGVNKDAVYHRLNPEFLYETE